MSLDTKPEVCPDGHDSDLSIETLGDNFPMLQRLLTKSYSQASTSVPVRLDLRKPAPGADPRRHVYLDLRLGQNNWWIRLCIRLPGFQLFLPVFLLLLLIRVAVMLALPTFSSILIPRMILSWPLNRPVHRYPHNPLRPNSIILL